MPGHRFNPQPGAVSYRIWRCYCSCSIGLDCGWDLIPGPGTPNAVGRPKKKKHRDGTPIDGCQEEREMRRNCSIGERFQEDGDRPPPPSVAVHRRDLLGTPSPRTGVLRLGSKKQQPAEDNCLHRSTSSKEDVPSVLGLEPPPLP